MKIYILGSGNMSLAMAYGLTDKFEIIIVGRDEKKLEEIKKIGFKTEIYTGKYDICEKNIILAFKAHALNEISKILNGTANICISVLAGVSYDELECVAAKDKVVCIPNMAAKFKSSITPFFTRSANENLYKILCEFGDAVRIEDERDLSVAGVISGCAPAYLAIVAEALQNAAVKEGMKKDLATKLINGLFKSTASLLSHTHPVNLKESVCSPGGTTIQGVYELERQAVRAAFMDALSLSNKKSKNKT